MVKHLTSSEIKNSKRRLFSWEILEAKHVFRDTINYEKIWIHENASITNTLSRLNSFLNVSPYPVQPSAVSIGYQIYFPVSLPTSPTKPFDTNFYKIPWLIHELTHVWQYQVLGWRYLINASLLQIRSGQESYEFGGENGLWGAIEKGRSFLDFNLEQQGDITRSFYDRLVKGLDTRAWKPFVNEIQKNL